MLAPLSGKERFCSVSTGHTVAFCRATSARCITPEGDLKDDDGRLDPVALTEKDESFREMVLKGWTWTVIPSSVEDRWPEIPELFQQSFNAKNNVAAKSTELEAACLMATHARSTKNAALPCVICDGLKIFIDGPVKPKDGSVCAILVGVNIGGQEHLQHGVLQYEGGWFDY